MAKNQAEIDAIYSQGADEIAALALPEFAGTPQRTPVQAAANVAAAGISEAPRATSGAKRAGPSRDDIIRRAKELDVDPDFALSLVTQESHGDFGTKDSDKGAVGGFQVMGDTYKGVMGSYGGQRDPWNNMEAGLRYIAYGQKTLATKDPALLAAGYHAGYDRDDLKAGKIPNTSDGHIKTADYARQIVARLNKGRGAADPEAGRYQPLSDEEAAQLEAKAQLDKEAPGRYKALTDEEAAALQAQAGKPADGKLRPNAPANQSLAPVTPEFRAQVERAYDAATPEQRQVMVGAEGVVGQLARERETRFAMAPTTPSAAKFDTRTEARAARLAAAGADGQIAEKWARQGAVTGQVPGSELGAASPSNFDWEAQKRFYETGFDAEAQQTFRKGGVMALPGVRAAVKGYEGYKQGALGLVQAGAELVGANEAAETAAGGIKKSLGTVAAMGESKEKPTRLFEGAVSSIAQQLPAMIGGNIAGGSALVLSSMFTQTFGQEYGETRAQGYDPQQSAMRAAMFGFFEVLGEKFGLHETMKAMKLAAKGAETKDIASVLSKGILKEIPGEELTTLGEFLTDKIPGVGTNLQAGLADYLEQATDTLLQTVMQGGIMMGGTTGVGAAVRHMKGYVPQSTQELGAARAQEDAMRKAANFWMGPNDAPGNPGAPAAPTGPLGKALAKAAATAPAPAEPAPAPTITPTTRQVVDDEGNVHTLTVGPDGNSLSPLSTTPEAAQAVDSPAVAPAETGAPAAESAPLSTPETSPQNQGDQPAASGAPAQAAPAAAAPMQAPGKPLEQMAEPELRERLKYIAQQAKLNGGSNKLIAAERRRVEAEIEKRKAGTPAVVKESLTTDAPATTEQSAAVAAPTEFGVFDRVQPGDATADLYNKAVDALKAGKSTIAGVKDPILTRARAAFDAGLIQSADDLRRFEDEGYPAPTAAEEPAPEQTASGAYVSQSDANDAVRAAARKTERPHQVVEREEDGRTVFAVQPLEEEPNAGAGKSADAGTSGVQGAGPADRPGQAAPGASDSQSDRAGDAGARAAGVEQPADAGTAGSDAPALSKELAGAKERYAYGNKSFTPLFHSDIDRAAFIASQAKPSKRDANYVKFVSDATGWSEAEVRAHGQKVRAAMKQLAAKSEPGQLVVLDQRKQAAPAAEAGTKPPTETPSLEQEVQDFIDGKRDTPPENPDAAPATDHVKTFGTAMRDAGLDMDGIDPFSWSMESGDTEIHAEMDGEIYRVLVLHDGDIEANTATIKLDEAVTFIKEFTPKASEDGPKGGEPAPAAAEESPATPETATEAAPSLSAQLAGMSNTDLSALIDSIANEDAAVVDTAKPVEKRKRTTRPKSGEAKPRKTVAAVETVEADDADEVTRTAGAIAKSLGYHVSSAGMEAIEGLTTLFGGSGRLSSGLTFDEETYAKAKPHFAAMLGDAQAAGKDLADFIRLVLQQFGTGVKPYIIRFANDQRDEQQGADHARTAVRGDGARPLEEVATQDVPAIESGRDAERGSATGEQGSGRADSEPDGSGVSAARSGGGSAPRADSAATGAVKPKAPRKPRGAKKTAAAEPELFGPDAPATPSEAIEAASPGNVPALDFVITDDVRLGQGSEAVKFADNLTAIRTLKALEAENRRASPEEQRALARYVGWGGLKNAFRVAGAQAGEGVAKGWDERVAQLEELLTPAELKAARNSTTAAHYTSQPVVQAIWQAAERLGFAGGAVLEPSVGTGNFLGLMPQALRGKSNVFAVEYDSLTARMAQKLYPNADILHTGLQNVPLPRNQFALAIGNPPFGRESLYFRHNPGVNGKSIHNQFFLASLDAVADEGLMAMVVSHNLMDALNGDARQAMAERAHFIGAIRLPDTAFKENARTEVVTDILFFRKRSQADLALAQAVTTADRTGKLMDWESGQQRAVYDSIAANMRGWTSSSTIQDPAGSGEEINVNPYFLRNPGMVVGKINASGKMNARADLNVQLEDPSQFQPLLAAAVARLPQSAPRTDVAASSQQHFKQMVTAMRLAVNRAEPGQVTRNADGQLKLVVDIDAGERGKSMLSEITLTADTPIHPDYTLTLDGKWQRTVDKLGEDGKPLKVVNEKTGKLTNRNQKETIVFDKLAQIPEKDRWGAERVALVGDMLPLRDLLKRQLVLEAQDATPRMMAENRAKLNAAYDAFVAKHGNLHAKSTAKLALMMPDGGLALATEAVDKDNRVTKSAIMSRRVTMPPVPAETAANARDAVAITLAEGGRIDLDRVASLLGTDTAGAEKALSEGDKPAAFFDPEENRWEPADLYLSGLVRRKLLAAEAAGREQNAAALREVIPKDWDSSQIVPNLGSAWIPPAVYADFIKALGYQGARVSYSAVTNAFNVTYNGKPAAQWATTGRAHSPGDIVARLLNSQSMKVTFTDHEGKTHVDEEATAESQQKANEIFNEFLDWAYQGDDRRTQLVRIFNEKFNTRVVRQRDGSHLILPGKVPDTLIKMRRHQMNAIWRGITDRSVLYDHVVGAGKTYTAIARAMERRRMGLSRKPLVVVPNHLVEQWAADVARLYPAANILAAGKEDFERANRRRLFARIGAGDYDMVIIGHSSFGFIDLDQATEERYLNEELEAAYAAIKEAEEEADAQGTAGWRKPFGVKEAERLVKKLEERLSAIRDGNRDRLLTFEEMGIDDLTVDEAHEFKNLAYTSRLTGVSGMGNKTGSQKAMDLHMKVRSLNDRPGTSVAFLTGTPISNSVAEMYLVLRNLVPKEMKEMGIDNFDAWRSMYVSYASAYEPTEAGGVKEVTRLGREWMNMKSLMDLYYSVSDAVTIEDIKSAYAEDNPGKKFPVPDVRSAINGDGDREMVPVKPTPEQREILKEIVAGFNGLDGIQDVQERNAERLRLMDRARKVSLDPRAVNPHLSVASTGGKLAAVVERVAKLYDKWSADRGTQLIFLDRSVPKAKGDDKIVKDYDEARAKLEAAVTAGDEKAEQKALDALEKFNPNEVEALRAAVAGGWNAYDEIKRQLVAKGVPADEIRFVQEANTDKQKAELFALVKSGEVRVLIGSTPRMGAGTNVQDRLVALHHVDVTWKPSDIEQREGRIVRQGNLFVEETLPDGTPNPNYKPGFAADVIAYATEMTVDAKMWALNATKLKAINGIRKYDGSFQMEFEDAESASMAEMAALATGNPLMVERVTLNGDIQKLEMQQRSYKNRVNAFRDRLNRARKDVESAPGKIARDTAFAAQLEAAQPAIAERSARRSITIEGKAYTDKTQAEEAAAAAIKAIRGGDEDSKARWSLDVAGKKVTNLDNLDAAILDAFGTPGFEATVDGKPYISMMAAARAIHAKMAGQAEKTFTIDGLTVNGIPVELDVEASQWADNERYLSISGLNPARQAVASRSQPLGKGEISAAQVRSALDNLAALMRPDSYRAQAKYAEREAATAGKDIPELEAEVAKPWPKEQELKDKRDRLKLVIAELASTSDAARLEGDAPANEPANDDSEQARASVGAPAEGVAAGLLRDTLTASDVGGIVRALLDAGRVVIHETAATLPHAAPRGVQASTQPDGTIHLVARNLTAARALPVLLHEMFHSGVRPLLGEETWQNLLVRLTALMRQAERSNGRARQFYDAAFERMRAAVHAGDKNAMNAEEFGAYTIEEYERAPAAYRAWADDVLGAIKAWLLRTFNLQAGKVTPAQLRALAMAALKGDRAGGTADQAKHSVAAPGPAGTGLTPPPAGRFERFRATVQDNLNRVKKVQTRIQQLTGAKDLGHADYYRAEANRPGRIAARLEDAQRQLTGPLMARLAKSGYSQAQLEELLHAQHAEERNVRVALINPDMPDGGSGMSTADARAILAKYARAPGLQAIAQQARAITRATLDLKLAYGLISQADYDALAKAYDYYVPLKGDGEYGPKVKRAMGHDGRDEHILENIARDYDQAVVVGEKNLARQALLALVAENDDPALWSIGMPPRGRFVAGKVYNVVDPSLPKGEQTIGSFTARSQVDSFLEGAGPKAASYLVLDSNGARVQEFIKPLQDNEVMVYVEGEPVRIQIQDATLAQQIRPLDSSQLHPILAFMRGMNRYLSKIYTGYNPAFIWRNAARDALTGSINMLGNEGAVVAARAWTKYPGAVKALAQWAATGKTPAGKTGSYLTEYRLHGGKTGASWMSDLEQQGKSLTRMYEDAYGATGYLRAGHGLTAAKVAGRKIVGGMAHVVEIANQATENALRLALYMTMRERGETPARAAQAAKNVTVDFDRKGSATGVLGAIYLFFNPAVQGTANALRTLVHGKHRGQAFAALGMLAVLGYFAASFGLDDDRDRWLGEGWDMRTKSFVMKLGGHTLRIPLSQEFAPAYAFGVAMAEAMRGEGAMKSSVRLVSSFLDAYFPLSGAFNPDSNNHALDAVLAATPTVLKPAAELAANRNHFGSPIVPDSIATKNQPDNLKMTRGTKGTFFDGMAQQIAVAGEKMGAGRFENDLSKVSPETLKYLWRTYAGGLGQFVTDSVGAAGLAATAPGAMGSSDIPILKDFWRENDVKPIRGRYYDLANETHAAAAEFQAARKAGDGAAAGQQLERPGQAELVGLDRLFRKTSKSVAALRDEAVTVNADPALSTADKRARLKELETMEEGIYRGAIGAFTKP